MTNISSEEDQENLSVIYNIYCFPKRGRGRSVISESDSSEAFYLLVTFMVGNVGLSMILRTSYVLVVPLLNISFNSMQYLVN